MEVLPADFGPCSEKEMLNQSRKFTVKRKNRTRDSHPGERNGELFVAVGQRRSWMGSGNIETTAQYHQLALVYFGLELRATMDQNFFWQHNVFNLPSVSDVGTNAKP